MTVETIGAGTALGLITHGSLSGSLSLRLDAAWTVEQLRVGRFVVIDGQDHRFFCLVTDMELAATDPRALLDPPAHASLAAMVLDGIVTYARVDVQPMLMLPARGAYTQGQLEPVRTIPVHFSPVRAADEQDVAQVFGREDGTHFALGHPPDMEMPVCIDLERFVERSNGIFGKSGTGKSFLTRLLLCGIIKNDVASTLVFDMHSEYGWETQSEEGGPGAGRGESGVLPGLRRLFPAVVHVVTLDPTSSRTRQAKVDDELIIGRDEIDLQDISLLRDELGLSEAMVDTCYLLRSRWGDKWLDELMETDPSSFKNTAEAVGAHASSLSAIYRKLKQIVDLPFMSSQTSSIDSTLDRMTAWLDKGEHIVLEFGRYRNALSYMLVSNILTRRIYGRWVEKTEKYLASKQAQDRPRRLVLVIEEAHKFLNPDAARNTSFGTIAREMRKFNVTLLVVDQRPSGIDPEVASQLGTRVTALLTEESDIRAVFSGVSGADHLRTVLASLDTKKQALIIGHAVPMPVVIRTREYDDLFFQQMRPALPTRPMATATPPVLGALLQNGAALGRASSVDDDPLMIVFGG